MKLRFLKWYNGGRSRGARSICWRRRLSFCDAIDDSIKDVRAKLRTAGVFWNPYWVTPRRYVTVKAVYIHDEGRWLYPDQGATYFAYVDDGLNYQV